MYSWDEVKHFSLRRPSTWTDVAWSIIWRTIYQVTLAVKLWTQLWRPFYKVLARLDQAKFINYGYVPLTDKQRLIIEPMQEKITSDQPQDKTHLNLYEKTMSNHPEYPEFSGLKLMELGCGHGGGVEWIAKTRPELSSVTGE